MGRRTLTQEEFIERMREINPNIEILGKYINDKTKIKVRCKIDGNEWEITPNDLKRGRGCSVCSNKYIPTHEEFVEQMKEINANIEILGEYINNKTKIKVRCKIDGHEWEVVPNSLKRGIGCPKCSSKYRPTHEEFVEQMKEINANIEILGEYINSKTQIKAKCKIDGHEWEVVPNDLKRGRGCSVCNESKLEKSTRLYLESKSIKFKREYSPSWIDKKRYDFCVEKTIIELDGLQHFKTVDFGNSISNIEETKRKDIFKEEMAMQRGYRIMRIATSELDNIPHILDNYLFSKEWKDVMCFGKEYLEK